MRFLRRSLVRTQIEITGSDQAVVSQDLLDMPDRAAIEEKRGRHGVTQHVRGHGFREADHPLESLEPNLCRLNSHGSSAPAHYEKGLALILAAVQVFFDPAKRPRAEK